MSGRKQASEKRGDGGQIEPAIKDDKGKVTTDKESLQVSIVQVFRLDSRFRCAQMVQTVTAKKQIFQFLSGLKAALHDELNKTKYIDVIRAYAARDFDGDEFLGALEQSIAEQLKGSVKENAILSIFEEPLPKVTEFVEAMKEAMAEALEHTTDNPKALRGHM